MLTNAIAALTGEPDIIVLATAPILHSAPVGPAQRRFANSAVLIETMLAPPALLVVTQRIERSLGRRRGQRWGNRPIDIDIILWSGGLWHDRCLSIPHPRWRHRAFVRTPLLAIAPGWRDQISGLTVRQIDAQARSSKPTPQSTR